MIRSKNKIYGELNNPNTVFISNIASAGKHFMVGSGNKGIRHILTPVNSIIITGADGEITLLDLRNKPLKVIATDDEGNIILINRSELS